MKSFMSVKFEETMYAHRIILVNRLKLIGGTRKYIVSHTYHITHSNVCKFYSHIN